MNKIKRPAVAAKKSLGQHFLTDSGIIERIADAIDPEAATANSEQLLEIGPGLGAITLPVLARAQRLTAIELDRRVIPLLRDKAAPLGELTLVEKDVLAIDFEAMLGDNAWRVFGNLPYNIATPILFVLAAAPGVHQMVFMLQKEVVQRMTALPGENHYGRLSVMLALHHDVYPLFDVPPEAFSPPPKVRSAMVGMTRLEQPRWAVDDECRFADVVKYAFAMRRKTLRNNLKKMIDGNTMASLGIDASQRAERLDGTDFAKISNYLSRTGEPSPPR